MQSFNSHGKLLLTGEYLVLRGATALAIPVRYGQKLTVTHGKNTKVLIWNSFDEAKKLWFTATFEGSALNILQATDLTIARRLQQILTRAGMLEPDFLNRILGCVVTTEIDFPRKWGLGTSSTLINNIAQWSETDPYQLLNASFGGSGYDIACAQNDKPLLFKKTASAPQIKTVDFDPVFKDRLFFVYLNQKQNSRKAVKEYLKKNNTSAQTLTEIDRITADILKTADLKTFQDLITTHEDLISKLIEKPPVKQVLFPDYFGAVKSLGAWGGDFILAAGDTNTPAYFKAKGYQTVIPFSEMVKNMV